MKNPFQFAFPFPMKAVVAITLSLASLGAQAVLAPAPSQASTATPASTQPGEDILDIRAPIHIPAAFPWIAWSIGTLAAAGLAAGTWVLLRRPRRKLPYEIALEKLAATRPLMEGESAQPFSLAVSEIVRLFIEECFPVRAAHRTTAEFLHGLIDLPDSPLAAHRETLAEFLQHCDLAKFARWSLAVPQMEALLASASTFVIAIGQPRNAKKPLPTPVAAPAAEPVAANS